MFLKGTSVLGVSVALFFTACKKGDAGPAGETGAPGPAGANGANGPTGSTGKTGSANFIYSAWMDVTFNAVDTFFEATIAAPKIVDSIIEKGEVKVYWNINSSTTPAIVSLPYADRGLIFGAADLVVFPIIPSGTIFLESNYNVGTRPSTADPNVKVWQYRYIIIPGGVSARSAVNWNDYKQVQQYLGLKD